MYFSHLSHTNNPANALQRQAASILKAESNLLIQDSDKFIASLKANIEKINADNPRCTPLRFSTNAFTPSTINIYLGEHFTVSFSLYLVKNDGCHFGPTTPTAGAAFERTADAPTAYKAFAAGGAR